MLIQNSKMYFRLLNSTDLYNPLYNLTQFRNISRLYGIECIFKSHNLII